MSQGKNEGGFEEEVENQFINLKRSGAQIKVFSPFLGSLATVDTPGATSNQKLPTE